MSIFDAITLLFTALISFSLLLIAVILYQLKKHAGSRFDWERRAHTIAEVRLSPEIEALIHKVSGLDKSLTYEALDEEAGADIVHLLNYFESIALAVNEGVYNEEVARAAFEFLFIRFFEHLRGFIYKSRSLQSTPSVYIQYERLVRRWKEEKTKD